MRPGNTTLGYLEENYPKLAQLVHLRTNINKSNRFKDDTISCLMNFYLTEEGGRYWLEVSNSINLDSKEAAI
jgi:hypothetical protein